MRTRMPAGDEKLTWERPAQGLGLLLLVAAVAVPFCLVWWQSRKEMPRERTEPSAELRPVMVVLPAGRFQMGTAAGDSHGFDGERPQHEVEITRSFAISETEVTQAQYQAVMEENPSKFKEVSETPKRPVESVSWFDAVRYCKRLSEKEGLEQCYEVDGEKVKWSKGLDCTGYRLPTEAEWEYAARAEEGTEYAGSNRAEEVAWFGEDWKKGSTHEVSKKKPNQWGLYDLSGNVWEWVWDEYGSYHAGSQKDPLGPLRDGSLRVFRGGSWGIGAWRSRVASRFRDAPRSRNSSVGFRLSRSYP